MIKDKINRGRETGKSKGTKETERRFSREDNFRNVRHGYKDKPSTVFQSRE